MSSAFLIPALIARIVINPFVNVCQKKLTVTQHPLLVNLGSYALLSLVSIVLVIAHGPMHVGSGFWVYSILGGIAGALGNGFIVKALQTGDLSVLGPVNAYKSIVGMVIAYLLIGEVPNPWGFFGIALIIAGSYVVLSTGSERISWTILRQPAIRYRLIALVLTGAQAVFDKKIILHADLTIAFCSWSIFGLVFSFLFCRISGVALWSAGTRMGRKETLLVVTAALSVGLMTISTNYVFSHMPVSEALALFQLSMLISVYFGYSFFRETGVYKKLLGALVMLAGSLMIILLK